MLNGGTSKGVPYEADTNAPNDPNDSNDPNDPNDYLAAQGVGFQPAAFGSFLKSVVVMYGREK